METIHGFWMYVAVLVPVYVFSTCIGLYCLKCWLDDRLTFLQAVFISGMFAWVLQPFVGAINNRALAELSIFQYVKLTIVNLLIWFAGVNAVLWLRSEAIASWYWWRDWRSRRSATR